MSWAQGLATALAALIVMLTFDRVARVRSEGGERRGYWSAVVRRTSFTLLPLLALSTALAVIYRPLWEQGYHLHFDLSGIFGWPRALSFQVAFLLPWLVWVLFLVGGLLGRPPERESGRWLAGAIGFGSSRGWVLWFVVPLAAILVATAGDVATGPYGYPAANWSTLAALAASLLGVALSSGQAPAPARARDATSTSSRLPLQPWPEAMRAGGIDLERVTAWAESPPPRRVRGEGASQLARRLEEMGARGVAPELIEAIAALVHPGATGDEHGPARLVFAPDDCGQVEAVAAGAAVVEQRFRAATLIVVARGAQALSDRLDRWLPRNRRAQVVRAESDASLDTVVWVTDAETLSQRLLPAFKSHRMIDRLGLVVWWGLESYTGVLGANLWAISRRLHRLIQLAGRSDVRTLALVRRAAHADAQMGEFVGRLLPHVFPADTVVFVEPRRARAVELYRLVSHHRRIATGAGPAFDAISPHPSLAALEVSAGSGWPTFFAAPPGIADGDTEPVLQLPSGDGIVRERLVDGVPEAAARLIHVSSGDVLSLADQLGQGGRNTAPGLTHHAAITLDPNPYLGYLLRTFSGDGEPPAFGTARRLVCGGAHPDVLRYHLLLALNEHPDTRQGLLRNFRLDEETVAATLREIAHEGHLSQSEVRLLDDRERLVIDQRYESRRPPESGDRPLDAVGGRLVRVLDRAVGHQEGGVRMRVDPERLTIQAYPHRRFLYRGRRYRINVWDSAQEAAARGELDCEQDAVLSWTWRIRNLALFSPTRSGPSFRVGHRGRLLSCLPVAVRYEEEVAGAVRIAADRREGAAGPEILKLPRELHTSFATRGLILRFPSEADGLALRSLAQALRHVLPVHLGVEEDALEVVPLRGETVEHDEVFGLAVVDLYPRGIGLVDAIRDDADFLLKLLVRTSGWLAAADEDCLNNPAALAANLGDPPLRRAALELLGQVVG